LERMGRKLAEKNESVATNVVEERVSVKRAFLLLGKAKALYSRLHP
jgi:hypothetical protein